MSKRRKRERETELRRRGPHREEREVHLVVCEGETEKRYFETMRSHPGVRLHTIHPKRAKHPQRRTVVDSALAQSSDEYTGVWAVFDTDGEDVTVLVAEARRGGVECAASTPTFERGCFCTCGTTGRRSSLGPRARSSCSLSSPPGARAGGPGSTTSRTASTTPVPVRKL